MTGGEPLRHEPASGEPSEATGPSRSPGARAAPEEEARTATVDDLHDVVALARTAVTEKLEQKGGALWARREGRRDPAATVAEALRADDHEVVVGTLDGTTIGYGIARVEVLDDGGRLGIIDDVYVDPGGRAVGVGEKLMDHLLAWCRAQGCFGVDSLALPGDRSTKNFFESFGLVARAIVVHRPLG
jgi:GNAT superfamily N-acetyltransferase